MKKLVNGKLVDMTDEEIAERQAEIAELRKERESVKSVEERLTALEAVVFKR